MNLLDFQTNASKDLKGEIEDATNRLKSGRNPIKEIVFKSPTGSGKTVMAFETIRLLEECFVVWIAPNTLHEQSYRKSQNTRKNRINGANGITQLESTMIKENPSDTILFLNWSSIDKDETNTINKENELQTDIP